MPDAHYGRWWISQAESCDLELGKIRVDSQSVEERLEKGYFEFHTGNYTNSCPDLLVC